MAIIISLKTHMIEFIKKIIHNISQKGGTFFTFLRAQVSSQVSSITDFGVTILLASVFGGVMKTLFGEEYYYGYATAIGAICGGIVNCTINYKWTFKAQGGNVGFVVIKYILVWIGSILLNTYGTVLLTELIKSIEYVNSALGDHTDKVFIVCKIIVSLLVGFIWNFNMQRLFVYKQTKWEVQWLNKRKEKQILKNNVSNDVGESEKNGFDNL